MALPLHRWQDRYASGSFVWEAVASPQGWGDYLLCFEACDEGSAVLRELLLLWGPLWVSLCPVSIISLPGVLLFWAPHCSILGMACVS